MDRQEEKLKLALDLINLTNDMIQDFKRAGIIEERVKGSIEDRIRNTKSKTIAFFADTKEELDNILKKANSIVYERTEEKERQYGDPVESFQRASKIASILCNKEISAEDIVKVQMSLKLSRESYCHKEDNLLDLVGYTSILNDLENNKNGDKPSVPKQEVER